MSTIEARAHLIHRVEARTFVSASERSCWTPDEWLLLARLAADRAGLSTLATFLEEIRVEAERRTA